MADLILQNYEKLREIRQYLIKKGQSRYKCAVTPTKLSEARELYRESESIFSNVSFSKNKSDIEVITEAYSKIKLLFKEVSVLCEQKSVKMEFELKTACSLIPVLDDKEPTTKRLIDAVEMYSEMLNTEGQVLLIKFVLKGRLSENAKLRVNTNYTTVKDMLQDFRRKLLTAKSFTAIQEQIQASNQGFRSIDDYGAQLEKLLTELNISQADGDVSKIEVLKPINEKMVIKKFADGLKNEKVSTIVTARNYSSLKDAIQAAKDECKSSVSRPAEVMKMTSARGTYNNNRSYYRGQTRGRRPRAQEYYPGNSYRDRYNQGNYNNYRNNAPRYQGNSRPFQYTPRGRGHYNRRGYARRGGNNLHNNGNIFTIPQNTNTQNNQASDNSEQNKRNEKVDQFFRNE